MTHYTMVVARTWMGFGVPAMLPPRTPTRRPASLPRVPAVRVPRFPRYYQGAMTSCRPSRRASFPSLGDTTCTPVFRPHAAERCRGGSPGVGHPVSPAGICQWKRQGSPTFLGNPNCALALLSDPGRTDASGHAMHRHGPRCVHGEGSRIRTFEAQSHGFGTGCLRFAGRVAPTPRKTRFRLLARLFRTGLITRRVRTKGFKRCVLASSSPSQLSFAVRNFTTFAVKALSRKGCRGRALQLRLRRMRTRTRGRFGPLDQRLGAGLVLVWRARWAR